MSATTSTTRTRVIASGLRFPEGPVAMPDGSVILVEVAGGTLTRVGPGGKVEVLARLGGSPNGAAIGPDGAMYVCNSGGFKWRERHGHLVTSGQPSDDYQGGSIQRVDPATGRFEPLYTECDGVKLVGPNDLVFDAHGGFYFTDFGKFMGRNLALGGLYYAKADGSAIRRVAAPLQMPNGCGLSPDGRTVYIAQTYTGWLIAWTVKAPGEVEAPFASDGLPGRLVGKSPGRGLFDSLAVEANGNVCVATIAHPQGGISVIQPDGTIELTPFEDSAVTNICFGGKDVRTVYVTQSHRGELVAAEWPRPGLRLHHQEI